MGHNTLWFVVRGESPTAPAADPQTIGLTVPDDIINWASKFGHSGDDPDVYILVSPNDNTYRKIDGEITRREYTVHSDDLKTIEESLKKRDFT